MAQETQFGSQVAPASAHGGGRHSAAAGAVRHDEAHGRAPKQGWFQRFAVSSAVAMGSKWAFGAAIVLTVGWAAVGPLYEFSDTWQLWMNTLTTVVTFLMVFVIQNTQNREALATQLKLDEIIRSIRSAHDDMIDIEKLSDEELEKLSQLYHKIREESDARAARRNTGL